MEARFFLQPYSHDTDRKKVIVAIENLCGAEDDLTSNAPKEWARLEVRLNPHLKDNWTAFSDRLRLRYQNTALRQKKVEERQNLTQKGNTVQWYKQQFELLCYETNFPKQIWGEDFYKGLSPFIKDKLASVAFLDRQNYELLSNHAVQFDEAYLSRQREKNFDNLNRVTKPIDKPNLNSSPVPPNNFSHPTPRSTDSNGRITQEVRDYRKSNNLCMFDGCNYRTHLCPKLIEKCRKEGKPMPINPDTLPPKSQ